MLDAASGQPLTTSQVDLPAHGSAGLVINLPDTLSQLAVRLDSGDSLPLDDRVETGAPGGPPRDVLLVSAAPGTLQRALEAIPSVRLRIVSPGGFDPASAQAALTVLDGVVPDPLPPGPLLLVNPPAQNALLPPAAGAAPVTTVEQGQPLLQGVDVAALALDRAPAFATPAWARALVASGNGGLVFDGRRDGREIVVLAFDPAQNGRDKSLAFPLLVSNAVSSLLTGSESPTLAPGQPITLPAPPSGRAVLLRPDGSRETLTAKGDTLTIDDTDQVGTYRVIDAADTQSVLDSFAVNLLDPAESDIQTRAGLAALPANLALPPGQPAVFAWWWLLVGAGAGLLGVEWLVFARRA